jgi:putative transposase
VVWTTKYRRPVLDAAGAERLKALLAQTVAEHGAWLVATEVMPDHVQLLVEVDPSMASIGW